MRTFTSHLLLCVTFLLLSIQGFSQLAAGDIALIGINTDDADAYGFVALVDIPASTTIHFTDNGIYEDGSIRTNEGTHSWSHTSLVSKGTVVTYEGGTWSLGSSSNSGNFSLSTSGDQLIVYTGTEASPTYIFGLNIANTGWITVSGVGINSNQSYVPLGLTNGANAIHVSTRDNGYYSGTTTGTAVGLLSLICDNSEWTAGNSRYNLSSWASSFTITGGSSVDNPGNFNATAVSSSQIDLGWDQNGDTDPVMIVFNTSTISVDPADGTSYSVGHTFGDGSDVIYNQSGTSHNHTGLNANIQYYYRAWSVDGSSNYSSGVINNATTFKNEPSQHVFDFMIDSVASYAVLLSWLDNNGAIEADGFLVLGRNSSGFFPTINDGTPIADDIDWSDNEVAINLSPSTEQYTWINLLPSTQYYFTIYPYTNSGVNIDYKTDGTVPEDDSTSLTFGTIAIPFADSFDNDLGDCYIYSVSGQGKYWEWEFENPNGFAQANGFNGANPEEDWMIFPAINFNSYVFEFINFDLRYNYGNDDDDNYLKLFYSDNYPGSGDPTSGGTTWNVLSFNKPSSSQSWESSGNVDLSGITGTSVYLAFKYRSTTYDARKWNIDDVSIEQAPTDPEPTNYPGNFTAAENGAFSIITDWDDATGTQLPTGYLIIARLDNSFSDPIDFTAVSDDSDWSDGQASINIAYGLETYTWTGLSPGTEYFFRIFPYSNTGGAIDYKTLPSAAPTANATTGSANLNLIISEVADPHGTGGHSYRFVELYNAGGSTIDFSLATWYLSRQSGTSWADIPLSGSVAAGETFVIAFNSALFQIEFGFTPDQESTSVTSNGDDGYFLYLNGDHENGVLKDAYGEIDVDGSGRDWDFEDSKGVRIRSVSGPKSSWDPSEWDVPSRATRSEMTPGTHLATSTWLGTSSTDWHSKGNNWSGTYGYIPDASFNVTIPDVANDPVINDETAVYNISVQSGAILEIVVSGSLKIYGIQE